MSNAKTKKRIGLTADRLRELLIYCPDTGIFTSRVWRGSISVGDQVGTSNSDGYIQIQIYGVIYYAHRLAWLYMTGEWPVGEVDHKNTIPGDNWFENLRDVSTQGNAQNKRRPRVDNKSGMLGVSKHSQMDKWVARIKIGAKYQHLGCFVTPEEAQHAYLDAKRKYHSTCTI